MSDISISRKESLVHKVVLVDGQPGCGKTMLSPVIASFRRVELMSYIFELEFVCTLFKFKKIKKDAALSMIKMLIDHKIYQTMMGRETNFRYSDLSSAFRHRNPQQYFARLFDKGGPFVPKRILKEKPILNINTHSMLGNAETLFEALNDKLIFVEVVRHPLYMLIQQTINMENLIDNPRDIKICYNKNGIQYPFYAYGWERKFKKYKPVEKAIYLMFVQTVESDRIRKKILKKYNKNFISIPFERFVLQPNNYLNKLKKLLGTKFSKDTENILYEGRIPRTKIADGMPLPIYERCGWQPSKKNNTEREELDLRRNFAVKKLASKSLLTLLDKLSSDYEKKHLKGLI